MKPAPTHSTRNGERNRIVQLLADWVRRAEAEEARRRATLRPVDGDRRKGQAA